MTYRKRLTLRSALLGATLVLASAAFVSLPLSNMAIAKNGGGNGGGHGNGGGNGGGHGNGGGNGSGNAGGKSADHAAKASDGDDGGQKKGSKNTAPDEGLSPNQLGKLNGFFHAAPQALENASPNSAPGQISQVFRDLLRDYVAQQEPQDPQDPQDATEEDPNQVSLDDLAHVLADASNKKMTPGIVNGVLDRLTEVYGDDYSALDEDVTDESATGDTTQDTATDEPEPQTFAEELSDRVNEINGFGSEDEAENDPS